MDKRLRYFLIILTLALLLASLSALAFALWPIPSLQESIRLAPGGLP